MIRKTEYIGYLGKYCDIVELEGSYDWFRYRKSEEKLPTKGAFCKICATETAKPEYPIFMNGRPAYALKCSKCGSEYAMYQNTYVVRYIGYDLPHGGHVNPTKGTMSITQAMDRKARENRNNRHKQVDEEMQKLFNMTPKEYAEQRKKWDAEDAKRYKKFKQEMNDMARDADNRRIQYESDERKRLIQSGILKYVKNIGLVNTDTGEVVKL